MTTTKLATLEEAMADLAFAFHFPFSSPHDGEVYNWTVVIRRTATIGDSPRVDMFEEGRAVGAGYLPPNDGIHPMEDGPMFDGSHSTPTPGGVSNTSNDDDEQAELDHQFGAILWDRWNLVAATYRKLIAAT